MWHCASASEGSTAQCLHCHYGCHVDLLPLGAKKSRNHRCYLNAVKMFGQCVNRRLVQRFLPSINFRAPNHQQLCWRPTDYPPFDFGILPAQCQSHVSRGKEGRLSGTACHSASSWFGWRPTEFRSGSNFIQRRLQRGSLPYNQTAVRGATPYALGLG